MLKENKVARQAARTAKTARMEFIAEVERNRISAATPEAIRMARMMDKQIRFNALENYAQYAR